MMHKKIRLAQRFYLFLLPAVIVSGLANVIYHGMEYRETTARYYQEAMRQNVHDLMTLSEETSFRYCLEDWAAGYAKNMENDLVDIRHHFVRHMASLSARQGTPIHMVFFDRDWNILLVLGLDEDFVSHSSHAQEHQGIHAEPFYGGYQDFDAPYSVLSGDRHKAVVPLWQEEGIGAGGGGKSEILGFVHSEVLLPLGKFREEALSRLVVSIQWAVGQIIFLALLLYWVGRSVAEPFGSFCTHVEQTTASRFAQPFSFESNIVELEVLRHTLNTMRSDILSRQQQLTRARDDAMIASQAKSDFLANMSHEIRTPMNAVIGLSDLALQDTLTPKTRDYLTKIFGSSRFLLRIIDDILDFSKIEAGKLSLERSDFLLREIFEHLADMFRAQTEAKHIELILCVSGECQYELYGDAHRLEQVLLNLIGNAIKFTHEGEVEVQVKTRKESRDQVTLEFAVRDTGIGMTSEQMTKLFQAFSQVDESTTRQFGGTGLGLSISQRLVEMMGGSIWVDSTSGQGSVFSFTAVFQRRFGSEELDMVPPEEMERLRVLVVDDNTAARNALVKMLEMFNFEAVGLETGEEAIPALQQGLAEGRPFQLVVVDWFMPGMDGIKTVQGIREVIRAGEAPKTLLLMSDDREDEIRIQGYGVGVDAYLVKPVNCSLLFDQIMEIFGQQVAKAFRVDRAVFNLTEVMERIAGARVLLVEDNAINRQVAGEILSGVGLVVAYAEDGEEALQKVGSAAYDVVLMDIQMPKMDGYEATRIIRKTPGLEELPIIAMTAHALSSDREKCLAVGMDDHVPKPIDRVKLYAALMDHIKPGPRAPVDPALLPQPQDDSGVHLPSPEEMPGIDMVSALDRVTGNKALLVRILREFSRDYDTVPQEVRQAFAEGDAETARKKVHLIKGVAGNLGAGQVQAAAGALDLAIKQGRTGDWPALTDAFETAMGDLLAMIVQWQPASDTTDRVLESDARSWADVGADKGGDAQDSVDMARLGPGIVQLDAYLAKVNVKSAAAFDAIRPTLLQAGFHAEVEELADYIRTYKFKKARPPLHVIARVLNVSLGEEI